MPEPSRGRCVWVEVAGRRIKLYCRGGVQSVNVCTILNRPGEYEMTRYFRGKYMVTPQWVAGYGCLRTLEADLLRRDYGQHRQ